MLVSDWARANLILAPGTSPKPGPYVPEVFQQIIMDALCDPEVRRVTFLKSTQVGWTQILLAICGYYIDVDPKPVGLFFPRDADAKEKSTQSIAPMIAESPALRVKVREHKSRGGGQTQLMKKFPGGSLKIAGTQSAKNLRSNSLAVVLKDELDGWEKDVDGEGDPSGIVERRTDAYIGEEKIFEGSTPAKPKGHSPTEKSFLRGNQTFFEVPCPLCGEYQTLMWRDPDSKEYNLVWEKDEEGMPIPETVAYRCKQCRNTFRETAKRRMLNAMRPHSKFPHRRTHKSFFINALYSPWGEIWPTMAKEWHEAQGNPELLRAFFNLRLGETWDEGAEAVEPSTLRARKERYDGSSVEGEVENPPRWSVPMGACVLICTVDVQGARLEAQVKAFGPGEEEWLIDHVVFYGSPLEVANARGNEDLVSVWSELDEYTRRRWKHESGAEMALAITLIDTGYAADACYNFIQPRQTAARRIFACKGFDKLTKLGLATESKTKNGTIRLFSVATMACKDRIMDRLRVNRIGPSYSHFPYWTTDEYFDQLTAESKVSVKNKRTGIMRYEWIVNQKRNEVLDLTVYAHAGLWILQKILAPSVYGDLAKLLATVQAAPTTAPAKQAPAFKVYSSGLT